jgi:hypothetical protein
MLILPLKIVGVPEKPAVVTIVILLPATTVFAPIEAVSSATVSTSKFDNEVTLVAPIFIATPINVPLSVSKTALSIVYPYDALISKSYVWIVPATISLNSKDMYSTKAFGEYKFA